MCSNCVPSALQQLPSPTTWFEALPRHPRPSLQHRGPQSSTFGLYNVPNTLLLNTKTGPRTADMILLPVHFGRSPTTGKAETVIVFHITRSSRRIRLAQSVGKLSLTLLSGVVSYWHKDCDDSSIIFPIPSAFINLCPRASPRKPMWSSVAVTPAQMLK